MKLPIMDDLFGDGVGLLDLENRIDPGSPWLSVPRHRRTWESALADLNRLRLGWRPDSKSLATAPSLNQWRFIGDLGNPPVWLQGTVTGHPVMLDHRVVTTSPIIALDTRDRIWARTVSRFYRLQRAADEASE